MSFIISFTLPADNLVNLKAHIIHYCYMCDIFEYIYVVILALALDVLKKKKKKL